MAMTLTFVSALSFLMEKPAYGLLATLISVVVVAASVGSLGHQLLMTREISRAKALGKTEQISALTQWSTRDVAVAATVVGVGMGMAYRFLDYPISFCITVSGLTVLLSLSQAWTGVGLGQGQYVWALSPRDLFWRSGVITGAFVIYQTNGTVLFQDAAFLAVIVYATILALQRYFLGIQITGSTGLSTAQKGALRRSSINLTIVSFMGVFLNTLDMVVVGSFMSVKLAAEYFPANRLALSAAFVALALQSIVGPNVAIALEKGDKARAQKVLNFATIVAFLSALAIGLFLVLGFPHYQFLFATATDETGKALFILVLAQVVMTALGFGNIVLVMSGEEKIVRRLNLYAAAGAIALFACAIRSESIVVVASVVALVGVCMKIVSGFFAWRIAGLLPVSFTHSSS